MTGPDGSADATSAPPKLCPELPKECWQLVAHNLCTRDVCALTQCCRAVRSALSEPIVWRDLYRRIFACDAGECMPAGAVRRLCRRSDLQAGPWFDAPVAQTSVGPWHNQAITSIAMDGSKVVTADRSDIRIWSPFTGQRYAAIKTASPVSCVRFSSAFLAAIEPHAVRVWDIDNLRSASVHRFGDAQGAGPHLSDLCIINDMLFVSGKREGLKVLDPCGGTGMSVVLELDVPGQVNAVSSTAQGAGVAAGEELSIWDLQYGARTVQVFDGSVEAASILGALQPELLLPAQPFTHCATHENLVAAASRQLLTVWDIRSPRPVCVALPDAHPSWGRGEPCRGLHLDAFKLVVGTPAGATVHDIRMLPSGLQRAVWPRAARHCSVPVDEDAEGAREEGARGSAGGGDRHGAALTCLAVHGKHMVAGFDSRACCLWGFGQRSIQDTPVLAGGAGGGAGDGDGEAEPRGGKKKRDKKPPKRQNRYPKRNSK